ncbi:MAG: response regulator [Allosphingosinicella sp.]|uniref:response regulator n=1 Tax=Allosphingosinicella sp. TaxID=2823234 RepID=UPI003939978B
MTTSDAAQTRGPARALLAEDDELIRLLAEDALAMAGFLVTSCGSADEALTLLARDHFDLLVSDIVMPGRMDGIDLARAALVLRPGLRIILTSGHTDRQRALGELLPHVAFVAKPYRLDALTALAVGQPPRPAKPHQPASRAPTSPDSA